ncbi:hypothetical protein F383_35055 [Gossypium arboreum]|nr:hypothetical protein F383_38298 [Gossypium arboreum]KHF99631.1 hypothetical protein F383_38504 [Gossypium arboreum]KHG15643.1 hypothetical protein F383_21582 [Gossypium arboreum]KHG25718.1 hypothetical protein F383_32703 [Gossypium arboreum]KHG26650.1 hypothetical protein F383_33379 [Gossypium arboreum]
MSGTSAS